MTRDPASIWDLLSADLRDAAGPSLYEMWLAPLRVARLDGADLVLTAPAQTRALVAERFGRMLQTSAEAVLGPDVQVHVEQPGSQGAGRAGELPDGRSAQPRTEAYAASLHPRQSFAQFVIGDGNRFSHAAALAVAENPGTAYNPLFLCGPPGVGKTHLLHAIGHYIQAADPGARVVSTTAEAFANGFISALNTKTIAAFKDHFRSTDLLLVDDVQFLMAKAKTEEEFFHTFNALRDTGAQVVLTSDRSPQDLAALEERTRDRFASGLVAPLGPPDRPTRMAVLRKRAALDGLDAGDDVLDVLADRVTTNLRALEAALVRTVAYASLTQRRLDAGLAAEVLADLAPPQAPTIGGGRLSVEAVQAAVCASFDITHDELLSASRAAGVTWPRQLAMYLAREHTTASLPAIGARFGGRGHTTVMHACKRVAARIAEDPAARVIAERLSTALSTGGTAPPADRAD